MLARSRPARIPNDGGGRKCYLKDMSSKFTLADLEQRVSDRASASSEQSYTRQLLDKGVSQCAKKFGEEAGLEWNHFMDRILDAEIPQFSVSTRYPDNGLFCSLFSDSHC